ncbi:MAG: hypothetical protein Q9223_006317 [Gallowayella weberi]
MNHMEQAQRMRDHTNGNSNGPPRPPQNHQNASGGAPGGLYSPPAVGGPKSAMSRAEKFEDEKRRIIESCFSKRDADGSVTESYITHIRVVEDAAYPSSPPPVQSPEENKKPRIIVVAVRKTGRVRMHKARENANGTFSIGKTWNLDDLNGIESFTNAVPTNVEEQQHKQRAGSVGFIVTITKPYYWQAATAKEKEFFIFSLIKIFKKYTGGKIPELVGFDHQELETFSGAAAPQTGAQRAVRTESPKTESSSSTQGAPVPRTPHIQQPFRQPSGPHVPQYPPAIGQQTERLPPPRSENRPRPSQERSLHDRPSNDHLSQERRLRNTDSEEKIAQIPGSFPSSEFVRNLNPQNPQHSLPHKRSESPALRNENLSQPQTNFDRPATTAGADPSQDEAPYRVLHSEIGQNGTHMYGPQHGSQPRINQIPMPFRAGGPPSSQTSQESLRDIGRPSPADPKASPLVPRNMRSERPADHSRPPTSGSRSREPSAEKWEAVPHPSGGDLQPYNLQRKVSREESAYDEPRPATVLKVSTPDVTPPSVSTEDTEPDLSTAAPSHSTIPTPPETPTESHRPGLGPMIKTKRSNKEIASTFRKAALAHNAFKPRAGGAADRLREQPQSPSGEPDGITSVVPAPSLLKNASQGVSNESRSQTPDLKIPEQPFPHGAVPTLKVDSPPQKPTPPIQAHHFDPKPPSPSDAPEVEPEKPVPPDKTVGEQRRKRKSDHSSKYAKVLAMDPQLLSGRTFDIETSLNNFGWGEETNQRCTYEELQANVRKELARAEAGGWLHAIEQNDDRATALGGMMDKVIAECEELDGLLTLYEVELSVCSLPVPPALQEFADVLQTLSEDVAYIEAQSQGLQVQAANQKLLHTELKSLLDTISISASDLRILKDASLTKPQGIQAVEQTLSQLYTAMMTIDPKARRNATRRDSTDGRKADGRLSTNLGSSELSSIRAVRERKDAYQSEIKDFIQRFKQYMTIKFRETESQITDELENSRSKSMTKTPPKLDYQLREKPKQQLWTYSPLLLFSREMEPYEWEDLIRTYEGSSKKPYQEEFRDNIFAWKRITRKTMADEQEVLFTSQEKEAESLVGRKLTVKRSKTVRSDVNTRISSGDKPKDGKVDAYEAFSGALDEMAHVIFMEQNFVAELFHLTSAHTADFNDSINAVRPDARIGTVLTEKKPFEIDRDLARRLCGTMEDIYSFWPTDVQNLVDWVLKQDPLQAVGVIASLESKLSEFEDTNQEYLTQTVGRVHDRLITVFNRFVDEQIRGIEDTKVKIKKRKGVISFMKTFPIFSLAIEAMLPPLTQLPIRTHVDEAYRNINRAMFESLKFIAKETPAATQPMAAGGDPEDKEALNYHILLIENMNHYIEELYAKDNRVLSEWKVQAQREMTEHMDLYLAAVLRRPLGKLLDFLESAEMLLATLPPDQSPPLIATTRASHSRAVLKKVLAVYDAKEVRKGIETLKKRVEKHFGEADDVSLSRGLVGTVLRECEGKYLGVGERTRKLVREVYEGSVEVEWRDEDVVGAFRK